MAIPVVLLHGCDKPVSLAAFRDDESMLRRIFPKCLTQLRYGLRQIRLFYKAVPPDGSHQIALRHELTAFFDEGQKNLKRLVCERHGAAVNFSY
jgi:hypothetical protein